MKYLLIMLIFFSCKKADRVEPTEPRVDSVAVLKDADGWYIKVTARYPADIHRMIRVSLFLPEEHWILVKLPAGKTEVSYRIDPALGEVIRWEAHSWGAWPYPD